MPRIVFSLLVIAVSVGPLSAQFLPITEITVPELYQHIAFLASDSLKGRAPGTPEDWVVTDYCRRDLLQSGWQLMGEDGRQPLQVVTAVDTGSGNFFRWSDQTVKIGRDCMPVAFSANGQRSAALLFAGYGMDFSEDSLSWHDYREIEAAGKWVMVLRGDPEAEQPMSRYSVYSDLRKKALTARDRGAIGVVFVSGSQFDAEEKWLPLTADGAPRLDDLLVVQIKREVADLLLHKTGQCVDSLEARLNRQLRPESFALGVDIEAGVDLLEKQCTTHNVLAILPGADSEVEGEVILLGAHHDHLGWGGPHSGSRRPDTTAIHNGADDNASGVAAVLEIAEKIAARDYPLRRSVLVALFAAEERGLLGSRHFAENGPVDLHRIKSMVNIDMVGRLDPDNRTVMVGGTGTSPIFADLIEKQIRSDRFVVSMSPEGYGPSDHASFYARDIPVLFFTTGAHEDYHTPTDDAERIDLESEKAIADAIAELIVELADTREEIPFQEAGPKEMPRPRRFKITLNITPDHGARDVQGLRVQVVTPGGRAQRAGILKGDVIVEIDGRPVRDIYEYMHRLSELKSGQRSSVGVLRNGKKKIFIVEL